MALFKLNDFEQLVASYVPILGQVVDFERTKEEQKAIVSLYDEADILAVTLVKVISATLWWAAHIASATGDALGYSEQIKEAIDKANADNVEAWRIWLDEKYPADLRSLYAALEGSVKTVHKTVHTTQKVNLKPVWAAIKALQDWKTKTVTPTLTQWEKFYATWNKTYRPPVLTLASWLRSPNTFAMWALPPLVANMPSQLRKPVSLTPATNIALILTQTWTNDSDAIMNAILEWGLADT